MKKRISVVWVVFIILVLACNFLTLINGETTPAPSTSVFAIVHETRPDSAIRLTDSPTGASDQNPVFSPDGTRLLFTRFENGYNIGPAGLFILDIRSGQITRLTPSEDQDNVNLPGSTWNAVNDRIIFASDRFESDDLWRIAPDGSDFTRVTDHYGSPWYIEPSWSPDGEWIVFEASQDANSEDGVVGQIWKVRADGSSLTRLVADTTHDDRQPNWSPQGDRILFQRRALPDGQWDIYTIDSDGGLLQDVTNNRASDTDASWSPDGQWIVYSSDFRNLPTPNIFAIPSAGGDPIQVTQDEMHEDGAPSWFPNGEWIVFESHVGQDEETPAALWAIAAPISDQTTTPSTSALAALVCARRWLCLLDVILEPELVALLGPTGFSSGSQLYWSASCKSYASSDF